MIINFRSAVSELCDSRHGVSPFVAIQVVPIIVATKMTLFIYRQYVAGLCGYVAGTLLFLSTSVSVDINSLGPVKSHISLADCVSWFQ
jgi:hypothetical protein